MRYIPFFIRSEVSIKSAKKNINKDVGFNLILQVLIFADKLNIESTPI